VTVRSRQPELQRSRPPRPRGQGRREAEKAARQTVKDAKRLAADEVFRSANGRDLVETVAACKDLVRKPIETAAEPAWHAAGNATGPGWTDELRARVITNLTDSLARQ
jgi:hypothetical protein